MKEHPILFSAPMVRAILEGRKTQTRRIIKPQPDRVIGGFPAVDDFGELQPIRRPYGKPGDRLWVRETWVFTDYDFNHMPNEYAYRADYAETDSLLWKWKPSIHMPRAASRILLEVVNVRVERLRDISEADAIAEGVEVTGRNIYGNPIYKDYSGESLRGDGWSSAQRSFQSLWQSINGPESWEQNPWVWVVEFKRINQ